MISSSVPLRPQPHNQRDRRWFQAWEASAGAGRYAPATKSARAADHVAGARIDETVLSSLSVARASLHVDRVLVMSHTDCAANRLTAEDVRAAAEGAEIRLEGRGERNPEEALHRDLDLLLRTPALRDLPMAGAVFDVVTGRLRVTRRHGEHSVRPVRPRGST